MPQKPRKPGGGRKPSGEGASVRRRKVGERRNRQQEPPAPKPEPEGEVRLNRFIAQAGLCSRREADAWIAEGRVVVNGSVVTELGTKVDTRRDRVEVAGQPVRPKALRYLLLNKPKDAITTTDDERGRRTVMDLLSDDDRAAGVVPVGRLDRDTTGVLILTNDGDLAHRLMHPRYEVEKLYVVETERPVSEDELDRLLAGLDLEDGPARADRAAHTDAPNRVGLSLHEGRNRQVRRMFEALGHAVVRLDRVRYAGLQTGDLRRGASRPLDSHEVNRLRKLVRLKPIVF